MKCGAAGSTLAWSGADSLLKRTIDLASKPTKKASGAPAKTSAASRKAAAKTPAVKTAAAARAAPAKRAAAKKTAPPLLKQISASLDDSKAENIVTLDLRGRTSIADYMIVATGRSTTHVSAIADRMLRMCKEAGLPTPRVEGMPHCDWVLVDANDVIVHIFRPDVRAFYNLEKMWGGDRPVDGSATHAGRAG